MMSIVIGCETTNGINEKLGSQKLSINIFDNLIWTQLQINRRLMNLLEDLILIA